jgi:HK97 family phage prohead protease
MTNQIERRFIPLDETEIRIEGSESEPIIEGYSARFNKRSQDLGGFVEQMAPGAFAAALKTSDTLARFNHDSNYVLGRVGAGTLTLKEDGNGLHMRNVPPPNQWARDLVVSIRRRDIAGQSFAFKVEKDSWEKRDGVIMRTINLVKLLVDVGPVATPAYLDTSVAVRSLDEWSKAQQESDIPQVPADDITAILRFHAARLKQALAL